MSFEAQKAKARQLRYTAGSLITLIGPALGAALLEGGASKWAALGVVVLGLLGGSATNAVAAHTVRKQINDGSFDAPEPQDTKTVVAAGLQELADQYASSAGALNEVTQVATSVLPGLAPAVADAATAVEKAIADFTAR